MMTWWIDDLMGKSTPEACIGYSGAVDKMHLDPILGKITAPTLVVTTEASPLQPVSAARAYQEKIPKSRLLVLPGEFVPHRGSKAHRVRQSGSAVHWERLS